MVQHTVLEAQVGAALRARNLTIAVAESCTGGLIAKRLTDIPNSSTYMLGGVVAYSDILKQQILGVRLHILIKHGTVSKPVAHHMAHGARILYGADVALGITGIAGPGGATEEKPLGLTFIGLSTIDGTWVRRFVWQGDRIANRDASADAALRFVLDYLEGTL